MNKQYFVNVVNLETGKIFSLPTLYTDRTEACICGQNYVRDRQAEDRQALLFFRVLIAKDGQVAPSYSLWEEEEEEEEEEDDEACPHPEQESCEDYPFYSECWDFDDEEPKHGESVYGNAEEPSSEFLAEILSVFNAIRPNY